MSESESVIDQESVMEKGILESTKGATAAKTTIKQNGSFFREHPGAKWLLLVLIVVGATASIGAGKYFAVRETTDDAQIDAYISIVSARVGGNALSVDFDDHQRVTTGQTLVQIDTRDYKIAFDRAQGELADAMNGVAAARTNVPLTSTNTASTLATAQAGLAAAEKQADAADARVREAEANHGRIALDLQRMKELIVHDEITRQQYDNAVAGESAAQAGLEGARSAAQAAHSHVEQARAQLRAAGTAPEQIAISKAKAGSAQAVLEQRRSAVDRASLDLDRTTVKSPINGIASKRNVQPGQVVSPGQPLLALVDLDSLWCTANFKETQLRHMKVGQSVKIHVDAYNVDFSGRVEAFGGATGSRFSALPAENATGNYVKVVQRVPVKIVFDRGQDLTRLRPGMSAVVTVVTR